MISILFDSVQFGSMRPKTKLSYTDIHCMRPRSTARQNQVEHSAPGALNYAALSKWPNQISRK